ncbi:MAG: hypothetical protein FRX49_01942 [Trebouxia sp. A1-2]|nr:MAG: hypothetical protein FRX49_01942 [Trebouxia sp. A1-2]
MARNGKDDCGQGACKGRGRGREKEGGTRIGKLMLAVLSSLLGPLQGPEGLAPHLSMMSGGNKGGEVYQPALGS